MNESQNPIEIIQILPKLVHALYSDGVLYFSGEIAIATEARKVILCNDIAVIKQKIADLEEMIN